MFLQLPILVIANCQLPIADRMMALPTPSAQGALPPSLHFQFKHREICRSGRVVYPRLTFMKRNRKKIIRVWGFHTAVRH